MSIFGLDLNVVSDSRFAAFEGADAVFHMAAPDSSINNYKLHHSVNVEGCCAYALGSSFF